MKTAIAIFTLGEVTKESHVGSIGIIIAEVCSRIKDENSIRDFHLGGDED